jgi:hypothetical protein
MGSVKSIKCTNCAAPLDLLGGGRVETITCSYCKSTLDLNDNYRVLSNFKQTIKQQNLPFKVGMVGTLKGVEYTLIGLATYRSVGYPISEWTDFLLFSPLYGYAYLTYENGHLIYSKRNRTFPNTPWDKIPKYDAIAIDGKPYVPFDQYDATISYVEGELTWVAKRDDKSSFIDLINAPYGISVEKSKNEIEHYKSEYLEPSIVYEAFGIEKEKEPSTFHVLKPFERPFLKSLSLISFWVLFVVALFAAVILFDGQGKVIQRFVAHNTKPVNVDFYVNDTKYLVDLELSSSTSKELDNFKLQIHKDNKVYFSISPTSAYLFSDKTDESIKRLHPWDKKSTKVRVSLNIEEKGTYKIKVNPINKTLKSNVSIQIKEASSRLNYFAYLFILTLTFWLIYKYFAWRYERKVENERGIYVNSESKHSVHLIWVYITLFIGVIIFVPNLLLPFIFVSILVFSFIRPSH